MRKLIDLTNKRFGRWTVTGRAADPRDKLFPYWNCVCDCGRERVVRGANLRNRISTSCGCQRNQGGSNSPMWKGEASQAHQRACFRVESAIQTLQRYAPTLLTKYEHGIHNAIPTEVSREILRRSEEHYREKLMGKRLHEVL